MALLGELNEEDLSIVRQEVEQKLNVMWNEKT
jgi:hypothetical protein